MRKYVLLFLLVSSFRFASGQEVFQLAPPLLKYTSVFFEHHTTAEIKFAQEGTLVHYTLDGREPSEKDPVYQVPLTITGKLTTLKAKAFGAAFLSSATASVTFIKNGKHIKSLHCTPPHAAYPGNGEQTLFDNQGGVPQTSSKHWMGYQCDTVTMTVELDKRQKINSVLLDFLQSENAWVFLPETIRISGEDRTANSFELMDKEELRSGEENTGTHCRFIQLKATRKIKTRQLHITLTVMKAMPAWHSAKGQHAWMFIDELKIY